MLSQQKRTEFNASALNMVGDPKCQTLNRQTFEKHFQMVSIHQTKIFRNSFSAYECQKQSFNILLQRALQTHGFVIYFIKSPHTFLRQTDINVECKLKFSEFSQ